MNRREFRRIRNDPVSERGAANVEEGGILVRVGVGGEGEVVLVARLGGRERVRGGNGWIMRSCRTRRRRERSFLTRGDDSERA